jgi:hypothetical protein
VSLAIQPCDKADFSLNIDEELEGRRNETQERQIEQEATEETETIRFSDLCYLLFNVFGFFVAAEWPEKGSADFPMPQILERGTRDGSPRDILNGPLAEVGP